MALALSVLDLIPVHSGQSTSSALAASVHLARVAEEAGCRRFWVAEHHNTLSVASTSPPVLIGLLASATSRLRLGSGGVMLPNHAPLAVAEQFALLEAAFPGRIDLGIGRAPGTDPVTAWALRSAAGPSGDPVGNFDEYVRQVIALLNPGGASLRAMGRTFEMRATPRAVSAPQVWLLGSSDYSARLAAQEGLPYVFASHFGGPGAAQAMALYRDGFAGEGEPVTFLTVNVVVADTDREAARLALPFKFLMAALRTGQPGRTLMTVEEAESAPLTVPRDTMDALASTWLVGTPTRVADGVRTLAAEFGVDEVMVQPVSGSYAGDPLDRTPSREHAIAVLAAELAR